MWMHHHTIVKAFEEEVDSLVKRNFEKLLTKKKLNLYGNSISFFWCKRSF
jgi:hypothetical protein